MSFKNLSEAVHFLTTQRYPEYLTTGNPDLWDKCNTQVVSFLTGGVHNLNGAEQVNVYDVYMCGEPKHTKMFKQAS